MPYNEKLADRIREAIADAGKIEEKKMFKGMCFMLNDKMCICVNQDEILCRVGPEAYEAALEKNGARPMVMGARTAKDYVYVNVAAVNTKKELDYWVNLSLAFNKDAKSSKARKKK
jgi:TfoX/Sxy family transcriptional regulator of competence genes